MKGFVVLWLLLMALPLGADPVWVLKTGPEPVVEIPLNPVQPVAAWRGLYTDGTDRIWVYVTKSPNFFPPRVPEVRNISGSPWTVAAFFPDGWKSAQETAWLDNWIADFQTLASLPSSGAPILLPSVLK